MVDASSPSDLANLLDTTGDKPLVIVLLGPTASGKTALGIELARELQLDVINVDSRQLYREMDIGTAKPTAAQQRAATHHLLDLRPPDQPLTLQEFQTLAMEAVNRSIQSRGSALLVGGSGLYLQALTSGLWPPAVPPQPALRAQLSQLGQATCHALLQQGMAGGLSQLAQLGPQSGLRWNRRWPQTACERLEVEAAAPHQQGAAAALDGPVHRLHCERLKLLQRQRLIRWPQIQQVMGGRPLLRCGRFGGADVHLPIELAGIHVDHVQLELPGQLDPQGGFAARRGAEKNDHQGLVPSRVKEIG